MFDFIRKRFVVAEVDGIRFYSSKALHKYLEKKELQKSREGKHLYTFEIPWYQRDIVSEAKVYLEERGCLDYTISDVFNGKIIIRYWHPNIILRWKN